MKSDKLLPTDEERRMLQESARGFLERHWSNSSATALAAEPEELTRIWQQLASQGFATLGTDPSEAGLREILIVMEELGRAACPALLPGAVAANLLLWPKKDASAAAATLLSELHAGRACVSVALGAFDLDPNAGSVTASGGVLSGKVAFVEGAASATHFLFLVEAGPALAIVRRDAPGLTITETRGLAVPPLAQIDLARKPASLVGISREQAADLNLLSRLFLVARELGKTGWYGIAWPKQYGGQERTAMEQLAYLEEMERAEAPRSNPPITATPIMLHGTAEQKQKLLPAILRGEITFGIGYSEPDTGSDLASLRTSAVLDGGDWVINGQKVWTTQWYGDYIWLAVRTDPAATPKHAGISVLIVPMNTPGVTVRTTETMYGGKFANIFFDNVHVPASALVGEVNGGWKVITSALANERLVMAAVVAKVVHNFQDLVDYVRKAELRGKPLRLDPVVRDQIGELAAEIEVGRQMLADCAVMTDKSGGETPMKQAAMAKVFGGDLMERFSERALDILGMGATLSKGAAGAIPNGNLEEFLRLSIWGVIAGGTGEIQRNLIAIRGLGLPR